MGDSKPIRICNHTYIIIIALRLQFVLLFPFIIFISISIVGLEHSRSAKKLDGNGSGFVPLRNKIKAVNGVRFPSGSPIGHLDAKRHGSKLVNQSGIS